MAVAVAIQKLILLSSSFCGDVDGVVFGGVGEGGCVVWVKRLRQLWNSGLWFEIYVLMQMIAVNFVSGWDCGVS